MKKPGLDAAYGLKTPQDSVELYSNWAETYDESFAQASGYLLPDAVAEAYLRLEGQSPVLDVGAGTGLVGEALAKRGFPGQIDGTDISALMLAEAALKDRYETLFEGDLTATLDVENDSYAGIISAGTFTHGHVGPDAFDELLRVAQSGALFVLSINAEHFEALGFAAKLEELSGQIKALTMQNTPIYASGSKGDHAGDLAKLASFRKA